MGTAGGGKKPQSDMTNNDDGATQGGWREWQDLQAMHDLRAPDRNNAPKWQDLRAVYSRTAVCRAIWMHGARILPKPAHFGYMTAIYCH